MKVLVSDPVAKEGIALLQSQCQVDVRLGLKPEELIAAIGDYEALVVRSETKVTAPIIAAGKKLLIIGRAGVGIDNIDVAAATQRGIMVVNAPTGNTISAAEHSLALLLALARHVPQAHSLLKAGQWRRSDFVGVELRGKVLGVLGLGNVGSEVARRAIGLQMRPIAYDPFVSPDYAANLGVQMMPLEEVLKNADFITLHLPLTNQTRGIIGAKELTTVKPTVRIVNCARGGLVDEEALYHAVEEGRVAGAAVDVFSTEPATDNILLKSNKIIVTPHLGASTAEAQVGVAVDVAEQILAVFQGKPARYAVNSPFITPEALATLRPFLEVASLVGSLLSQLLEGQMKSLFLRYEGEIANYDTVALKGALLSGLLEKVMEDRVNVINANLVAQGRGLKITEQKESRCENYASLITAEVTTTAGVNSVAGTVLREQPHIVRVNEYWMNLVPAKGYFLFSDHRDRPGLIGSVGMVTGKANINISSMMVSRLKPRGQALMVMELEEPLSEEHRQEILAIPDVYSAKLVKF